MKNVFVGMTAVLALCGSSAFADISPGEQAFSGVMSHILGAQSMALGATVALAGNPALGASSGVVGIISTLVGKKIDQDLERKQQLKLQETELAHYLLGESDLSPASEELLESIRQDAIEMNFVGAANWSHAEIALAALSAS